MRSRLPADEIRRLVQSVPVWHHTFDFGDGIVTGGNYDPARLLDALQLPDDMSGQRVLDVGTCDGYFAFACEARGATVVAMDHKDRSVTGFDAAREILGAKAEYVQSNVYDLTPESLGQFDLVLFLGVLYHLRHPLLALDAARSVCAGRIIVESLVCDESFFVARGERRSLAKLAPKLANLPVAQYLSAGRFHEDVTNKWVPNLEALKGMLGDANFEVTAAEQWEDRAVVHARAVEDPLAIEVTELDRGMRHSP